jgi:hypothetical protein
MNHASAKAAFNKGMADRSDGHQVSYNDASDKAVYPSTPDQKGFSENDGSYGNNSLSIQQKSGQAGDRMPNSSNPAGYNIYGKSSSNT